MRGACGCADTLSLTSISTYTYLLYTLRRHSYFAERPSSSWCPALLDAIMVVMDTAVADLLSHVMGHYNGGNLGPNPSPNPGPKPNPNPNPNPNPTPNQAVTSGRRC